MSEYTYNETLRAVMARADLPRAQTYWAFSQIMEGLWDEAKIGGLLVALAVKGETAEELAGAAEAMREHVLRIDTGGAETIDTCGTGGTGLSTLNVSTAAALVVAGTGVKVAKHGNRTNTRASGSADVLAALGVNIDADDKTVSRCLEEANVGFCFAVRCHPAMKYAVPVRKSLGVRTIFNVLGPLTNPAGARRQLMGVFDNALTRTMAEVLGALGAERAMVVHAEDGLDEISVTATTHVAHWQDGAVRTEELRPEDVGIPRARLDDLMVGSPEESAAVIREVLSGRKGPARDIVQLNAAAALVVAGRQETIPDALKAAGQSIDERAASEALEKLIAISNT